jgi:medium-chain acyl-[acyl-carrier-protein] hydrolase
LFCFPYAGGGTSVFHAWPAYLPRTVEVCLIKLPGREDRLAELPFNRLPPLVEALSEAMLRYLDRPFVFFGHSMGALLAFELARRLRRKQRPPPEHLFVSGCVAPQLRLSGSPVHQLPQEAFIEELRRLNGTPEEVLQNEEMLELVLPVLRADFALCWEYGYTIDVPLDCAISAYGGCSDPGVRKEDLWAWREQTSGQFALRLFRGDHFFLHTTCRELLGVISTELNARLDPIYVARPGVGASHPSVRPYSRVAPSKLPDEGLLK